MAVDEVGKKVLKLLTQNSDQARKSLSRTLSINESSLSKKISELKSDGVIRRFTVDVDYTKLGYHSAGFFIFQEKNKGGSKSAEMTDFLKSFDGVVEINHVTGKELDVIIRIIAKTNKDFMELINRIRDHENVNNETSYSVIILDTAKKEPEAF